MKVLYTSERPPYPFFLGGAARSAHYLLSLLVRDFGVEALAMGSKDFAPSRWSTPVSADFAALGISGITKQSDTISVDCGYPVRVQAEFRASLQKAIEEYGPDVVWTQLDGVEEIVQIARDLGRKVVVFLRDAEDSPAKLKSLAQAGCCLICNSQFMARRIKRITGKAARVIYPSLDTSFGVSGDPEGFVTMINPHRVKGLDTFIDIAKRLPNERLLLVESWALDEAGLTKLEKMLADVPNVRFLRRLPDVAEVYRQTKLLLVPSVWEEAFGRVVIEAQSCGIPVIASNRGGLPEAVGAGGVCVDAYTDVEAWIAAIRRVLDDIPSHNALADRARLHASSAHFTPEHAARLFVDICQDERCFRIAPKARLRTWFGRFSSVAGR